MLSDVVIWINRGTQRRFPPKYVENPFYAIQSTFKLLEMRSKRCQQIFICSVILGELISLFEIARASVLFSKNFRCNLTFYESENFSDSSTPSHFRIRKFRLSLSKENSVTCVIKYEKSNFRKS